MARVARRKPAGGKAPAAKGRAKPSSARKGKGAAKSARGKRANGAAAVVEVILEHTAPSNLLYFLVGVSQNVAWCCLKPMAAVASLLHFYSSTLILYKGGGFPWAGWLVVFGAC